jgi:hypothetical protein
VIAAKAVVLLGLLCLGSGTQDYLAARFQDPPAGYGPWVFWYWMEGAVSQEGITADLQAMKAAGIEGAYLFFVRPPGQPPVFEPPAVPMTDRSRQMLRHAFQEADRLGLQLGLHACDGFSLAGGPWITPGLAMQKVVWSETNLAGPYRVRIQLPMPATNEGFYRDIAILAFPSLEGTGTSTDTVIPKVSTSIEGQQPQFLARSDNSQVFRSDRPCWIQYQFERPFTCRSILIRPAGTSFQPLRGRLEVSDDGNDFRFVCQLDPPRHGWQDRDPLGCPAYTFAIRPTTARYFRFVYNFDGSEPGAEDLDTAKWRPSLRIQCLHLSSLPRIHQFEGKSGLVWRVARRTTPQEIPDQLCIRADQILDITDKMDPNGTIDWEVPEGHWTILRIGHTPSGQRNTTGTGAIGLECDRFNPDAIRLQFDRWFGQIRAEIGPDLAGRVLRVFHTDSWESGCQNWSACLPEEFRRRRGYDLRPYLPVLAGLPVGSAEVSEKVLYNLRQTISELMVERFFGTLAELAHEHGCQFSAECTAPTFMADGMLHFTKVDIPMGESWLNSPTHDKPTDILEAISAAHVYDKQIVQAEAFTQLRLDWDEHPAALKPLGDLHLALGINRLVFHVFVHNPWMDRRPGMTMGPIGLFFQRDQTWFGPGRAWIDYLRRCQMLLQLGSPVIDIAVFTGQGLPSRAILPERLIRTLPGLIGIEKVQKELTRLANEGLPTRQMPRGVTACANIRDATDWTDPLGGYAYDSINPDALLRSTIIKGQQPRIRTPGGVEYRVLVIPASNPMDPDPGLITPELAQRLVQIAEAGIPVIMGWLPVKSPSLVGHPGADHLVEDLADRLRLSPNVYLSPFVESSLDRLGIPPDLLASDGHGRRIQNIAWSHRRTDDMEIYFASNQVPIARTVELSLRVNGLIPELWDPLTGRTKDARQWRIAEGRTVLPIYLDPNGSMFIVFRRHTDKTSEDNGPNWPQFQVIQEIRGPWEVRFDPNLGGPAGPVLFERLEDWTKRDEPGIRHYSGTAIYKGKFICKIRPSGQIYLDLGTVANVAEVLVNDIYCGIAWTWPYRVEIDKAIQAGQNQLEIHVTNTWVNRLLADKDADPSSRITWTSPADRAQGPLRPAGLLGPVRILSDRQD